MSRRTAGDTTGGHVERPAQQKMKLESVGGMIVAAMHKPYPPLID
jgi:hypothetical protein